MGTAVRSDGRSERWLLNWHVGAPGGESHADSVARALAILRHWDDGASTLVVAHGALIRDLLGVIDGESVTAIPAASATLNCVPIRRDIRTWPELNAHA